MNSRWIKIEGDYVDLLDAFEADLHEQPEFEKVDLTVSVRVNDLREDATIWWTLTVVGSEELTRKVCKWTDDWRVAHGLPRKLLAAYE